MAHSPSIMQRNETITIALRPRLTDHHAESHDRAYLDVYEKHGKKLKRQRISNRSSGYDNACR